MSPRWFVLMLFIVFMICCTLLIWHWQQEELSARRHNNRLRMVNILTRHGDRAPSDSLPRGDKHSQAMKLFWPNGLSNLTDAGKLRQYRIGLELRRQYSKYLGYDSNQILALSSPLYRCVDSMQLILRGLYNIDWTMNKGIHAALERDCAYCLPSGSGSALEWQSIPVNTTFLPSLFYGFLNDCKYRKENPSPVDKDLTVSEDISALVGLDKLAEVLWDRYKQPMSFPALGLWSTIASELDLVRTRSTIKYTDHYSDWINLIVSNRGDVSINLFDLYEQMAVFGYRDRVSGEANYIQTGPILTSIVESQLVAMTGLAANKRMEAYMGKRMILYSSHDSILQLLLHTLKIVDADGDSFEDRFYHWAYSGDRLGQFLAGLKMSSYGLSLKFELFEMEMESRPGDSFAHVQLSIYNQEDGKYSPVDYRLVELGNACQRLFYLKFPQAYDNDLDEFYDGSFPIDKTYSCPFDLFRNITAEFMIDDSRFADLCGGSGGGSDGGSDGLPVNISRPNIIYREGTNSAADDTLSVINLGSSR